MKLGRKRRRRLEDVKGSKEPIEPKREMQLTGEGGWGADCGGGPRREMESISSI